MARAASRLGLFDLGADLSLACPRRAMGRMATGRYAGMEPRRPSPRRQSLYRDILDRSGDAIAASARFPVLYCT